MPRLVFVADDYDHVALLMAEVLRLKVDWETIPMKDGDEVLALVRERRPDVCVLDIGMPHIGGVEAARRLRSMFPQDCPLLIAISGVVPAGVVAQTGFFDHAFEKPLDVNKLIALIAARGSGLVIDRSKP